MFALIVGITTCAVAATYNFLFIEVRELVSEIERIIVFLVFRRGRKFNAHVRAREMNMHEKGLHSRHGLRWSGGRR
jgi:hypothetical protein